MKKSRTVVAVLTLTLIVLCAGGCDKPTPTPEVATQEELAQLYTQVGALLESGQTNAAVERLSAQIDEPTWAAFRSALFRNVLYVLLQAGRYTEAEDRLFAVAGEEELARDGLVMVHTHYERSGHEGMSAWTERLLWAGFAESLRPTLLLWHGQALFRGGKFDQVLNTWIPMVRNLSETDSSPRIMGSMLRYLLHSAAHAQTEVMTQRIEELFPDDAAMRSLVAVVRAEIFSARKEWDVLDTHIHNVAAHLEDADLHRCLRMASGSKGEDMDNDRMDKLYRFILDTQKEKALSISFAAQRWIQSAVSRKDVAAILARFGTTLECKIKPSRQLRMLHDAAYVVLQEGTSENRRRLLQMADTLQQSLESDVERGEIVVLRLDAAFLESDYQQAITLIEAGIPQRDEAWHSMALGKLRAHLAIQKGNTKEAVRHFREFMKSVEKWDKAEQDPTTGINYTKEMTLGFNAKRIGDLLLSISDAEGADEAYREARAYYETAANELEKDSPEYELVQKEMAEVPAGKP